MTDPKPSAAETVSPRRSVCGARVRVPISYCSVHLLGVTLFPAQYRRVVASDGHEFVVLEEVLELSPTLKAMMQGGRCTPHLRATRGVAG